ncbi:YhgE/Pip domain-containing protein [Actinospica robiniae]|uniref:YhgE/Pip domain-containing protein n=1 Tax=Actinospica robiniae TaxID=304901 RepID=UPI00042A7C87|nr:DUF3533 domain-containing protein [Actinospica robiniae]
MKSDPRLPVRAGKLLRVRAVWMVPLVLGSVVIAVMTAVYISAVADPVSHLRGLPVGLVNQDQGATIGSQHLDVGAQIASGLQASPAVSDPLSLQPQTLSQAEAAMDDDGLYATVVIPPGFTADLLTVSGIARTSTGAHTVPTVEILTNLRAGTVSSQLATAILQPALAAASHQVGQRLVASIPPASRTPAATLYLTDPIKVTTTQYRPLPNNAALGLSAFYIALLTMMCGFLGGVIVNNVVDSALGYSTNEIGPRWRQRRPLPINRWQTQLVKWPVVVVLTAVLTAIELLVAAGVGMDTPYPLLLWVYMWLCAASVGVGTIVLFAAAGTFGQLIALLLFVYAGLASAGGTVPIEALPGPLRGLSNVEPLREILAGTRSIMYFGARADAGLAHGALAAGLGLLLWVILGAAIVTWYDRKRFYRLDPDVIEYVDAAIAQHQARRAAPGRSGTAPRGDRDDRDDQEEDGDEQSGG